LLLRLLESVWQATSVQSIEGSREAKGQDAKALYVSSYMNNYVHVDHFQTHTLSPDHRLFCTVMFVLFALVGLLKLAAPGLKL